MGRRIKWTLSSASGRPGQEEEVEEEEGTQWLIMYIIEVEEAKAFNEKELSILYVL